MPESPETKLKSLGAYALSSVELLAIGLAKDENSSEICLTTAIQVLKQAGGIRGLATISNEILKQAGMNEHQTAQMQAFLELGRRTVDAGKGEQEAIKGPEDVAFMFAHLKDERREHFCAILLDAKNRVIKKTIIHIGTLTTSIVGPREVFRECIREGASALIVVHNHPSGDPTPSPDDFEVTKTLKEAGALLDIQLLDHVIIGEKDFVSLQRQGAIR